MNITRSFFSFSENIDVRSDTNGSTITGYAAVFEKLSDPIYGMFREKIRSGAFKESLKTNNVRALWNHNSDYVLGSTKTGTLKLEEDDKGLRFELTPPDTQAGRDAVTSIKRGDVEGMSFGFLVRKQEWNDEDAKNPIRTLLDVDLKEISPTGFPAYPQTSAGVRSIQDEYEDYQKESRASIAERKRVATDLHKEKLFILSNEV